MNLQQQSVNQVTAATELNAEAHTEDSAIERYVNAATLAAHLGISHRTVAKMAREGRIPAHPVSGTARRTWRFKLSEVERYLALSTSSHILALRPGCSAEGR